MQDRISTYPGRWKLTPVPGETNVYDFERADEPVVAGTPLNKATFLTDATATAIAALTGNTPSLPTEALDELAGLFDALGVNAVAHVETGSYVGTGTAGSGGTGTTTGLTLTYKPRMLIVIEAGEFIAGGSGAGGLFWQYPNTKAYQNNVSVTDNYIEWVTTSTQSSTSGRAALQMNSSGTTYYYLAIGVN